MSGSLIPVLNSLDNTFLISSQFEIFFWRIAVEGVVLELRPQLTKKKLLVSVAAGVKLKDLQVCTSGFLLLTVHNFLD